MRLFRSRCAYRRIGQAPPFTCRKVLQKVFRLRIFWDRLSFLAGNEEFFAGTLSAIKKKNRKKLFSPYKIIDSENFIKVSQNPNKVARDTQGLPTVPHNDFGGLNFKGLASKYLLLMTLPPADDEKMKKNRTSGTPTSKKTSDSASSSKVCHTKVKLKISETNFCKSYGPASEWDCLRYPPIEWTLIPPWKSKILIKVIYVR